MTNSADSTTTFATTCVHFCGIDCGVCKAGITYDSVKQKGFLAALNTEPRYPCRESFSNAACPKKQLPSPTEVAQKQSLADGVIKARKLIVADKQGLRGVSGEVPCPVCGKTLKYRSIPFSDALRFKCATAGCLDVSDV
jgi:hypothetical protein